MTRRKRPIDAVYEWVRLNTCEQCGCAEEEWRQIDGFPIYEVSNHGRVRAINLANGGAFLPGRLVRPTGAPYLTVGLWNNGKRSTKSVHRLVAVAFLGSPPSSRYQVAHSDGDALNNHASNLRWCTAKENSADRIRHGRQARGSNHYIAKLTEESVSNILLSGDTKWELARKYNVSWGAIHQIKIRKTWKHVSV